MLKLRQKTHEWQEFESAPKDGTEILICYPYQPRIYDIVSFNRIHQYWTAKGHAILGLEKQGTVWMDLPLWPSS